MTAPAIGAAIVLVPTLLVGARLPHAEASLRFWIICLLLFALGIGFAIGTKGGLGGRIAAGCLLAAAVIATIPPRGPTVFRDHLALSVGISRVAVIEGAVLSDLRPTASPYRRLIIAPIRVHTREGWTASAEGRISLMWEGPAHLASDRGDSLLPVRGDHLRVATVAPIVPAEEGVTTLWVDHDDLTLSPKGGAPALRRTLRGTIRGRLARLPRTVRGLASALLLGERGDLPAPFLDLVRRSGASHVLALSGMHLAVLAAIVSTVIARFVIARYRLLVVSPMLLFYVWIAGWIPSLVRALVLFMCAAIPRASLRRVPAPVLLARTIVITTFVAPRLVVELGYLLSVGALFGLILWTDPIAARLSRTLPRPVALYLACSAAAILGTGPISLVVFGTVYPIGIVLAGILSAAIVLEIWIVLLFLPFAFTPIVGTLSAALLRHTTRAIVAVSRLGAVVPSASGAAGVAVLVVLALPVLLSVRRRSPQPYEPRLDF